MSSKAESSPGQVAEQDDDDRWSGDEDDEVDADDGRTRKRQRTSRPISVSCEKCKERKVSFLVEQCKT
jgi:DNA-directed RNA polymerase subunit M/transcription elongation factor TFIIS